MTLRHSLIESPVGEVRIVADVEADADCLVGVYFSGGKSRADNVDGPRVELSEDDFLRAVARQLAEYFDRSRSVFELPVVLRGNEFQVSVWNLIAAIDFGCTRTYGELAADLGSVGLAQAVGRAAGQNPVGIVVGCHRVIGSGGKLVGYAGGVERKRFLLDLEEPAEVRESRLF
ncbi:methylated-DNA--protein-cysteine methyltransferase [Gordonia effusa NBRC 100432]|uniref:methylated-DNA--[protein]-cysteine S-methyltransferase n=1 Tax=Gordonia effusa NBRC 100432 TaxID=1077974 RepID=H0QUU7_9ACTN|nr:methylated-DNA--[protein]-cysteine S-methyltransferase [Gordonia effusa]GAB16598.1 methylated-DNA--protein-cysteine methyltransferase [Gordonia effusa NBRC 100432]